MSSTLELNCLVFGDSLNHIFTVEILRTKSVDNLKEAIKEKQKPAFDHIPANNLALWTVSFPVKRSLRDTISKHLFIDEESLLPVEKLSDVFSEPPAPNHLHIVVKAPPPLTHTAPPFSTLKLFCYVRNDDHVHAFEIKIGMEETVAALKKAIREERKPDFDHVRSDSLVLWNVNIPYDEDLNETVNKLGLVDKQALLPIIRMSKIFPKQPEDGHIHVVVKDLTTDASSRSRGALPAGDKSGLYEKPAIEEAWKTPFRGGGAALFKSALDEMNKLRDNKLYANFVPIIQSSGMGKSRLVDETAKLIFTIPFCFRAELDGYPEADREPRDYFRLRGDETFNSLFDRFLLFFEKLFIAVDAEVKKLPIQEGPLPILWYNHLLEDGNRNRQEIYKRVVAATENCANNPERPRHYPAATSKSKIDYPAYAAAKMLIDTINSCADEGVSEGKSRPVRLLIYIDESHEMTNAERTIKDDGRNAYQVLCSSLNELLELDLFFVFLSTNSTLSDYSPSNRIFWSKRAQKSGVTYVQTPYTELPFDVWKESHLVSEGEHTMDEVCSVEFMVRFGRPLWWTRWEAGDRLVKNMLIGFAIMKLAAKNPDQHDEKSYLAALSVRLLLEFEPRRTAAIESEHLMVAGYLRVANVIPSHREYIISSTPSEPIVAEAAAQVLRSKNLIELLFHNVREGLIEKGQRGELVARLLLTLAHDAAIEQMDMKRGAYLGQFEKLFTTPVPVLTFFSALFAQPHADNIMKCHPDNRSNGPTFEETFKDAYVMFTHFGKAADDWCNSDVFAFMALCRNMAISCREGMKSADLCIPIHFGKDTPLSRDSTSAIFVSIKDKEQALGYNRTFIDVNKMSFFTDGDKARPVILLILQLGIQVPGRYIPVERTKKQTVPGLLATPKRKGRRGLEVPQGHTSVSFLRPENTVEPPKTRAMDKISGPMYYTIDARGCSSMIYGVVRSADENLLDDLLASKDFLSEHGRQRTAHLEAVMAQKPVWTRGQECCSWANLNKPPPLVPQEEPRTNEIVLGRVHGADVFE